MTRRRSTLAPYFEGFVPALQLRIEATGHRPMSPTILAPEEFAAPSAFLDHVRSGTAVAVIGERALP